MGFYPKLRDWCPSPIWVILDPPLVSEIFVVETGGLISQKKVIPSKSLQFLECRQFHSQE